MNRRGKLSFVKTAITERRQNYATVKGKIKRNKQALKHDQRQR